MSAIGINTVRVYTTDPEGDHDGCMNTFASQGIYVWIDLSSPLHSISRVEPAKSYTMELFNHFTAVIDAFSKYNNTFSFTASNELINTYNTSSLAPYIKSLARDLKAFRNARGYRKIPISYTATDVSGLQVPTKDYLTCGDEDDSIELYGMNVFSWCGNSSYTQSGYDHVYSDFQNSSIPSVFSETGCNVVRPRTFGEVAAILGSVFPATFSGVVVYEWPQEESDYGLVKYPNSDGTGFPSTLPDYNNLASVYTSVSPVSTAMSDYTPTNTAPSCPSSNSVWQLGGTDSLPTIQALNIATVTARTTYYSSGNEATPAAAAVTSTGTDTGPDSTSSASDATDAQQAGLSTGAIAGIAVGGAVVGVAVAVLALVLLRKRKRRTQRTMHGETAEPRNEGDDQSSNAFDKAELPAGSANPFVGKQELEADQLNEADSAPKIHEMEPSGRQVFHEMPGSRPRPSELEGTDATQEMKW